MVLNYIWIAFFLVAFVVATIKLLVYGDVEVFPEMMGSTFDMAKLGFEISLGLTGVMTLWLGLMKVGENGGVVRIMAKAVGTAVQEAISRHPERSPRNRFHYDEPFSQSARS
jgi:spore maturation protein SpmA